MKEVILDTAMDSVKLLPFLFLTYLLMEWLEHRTEARTRQIVERSGRFGPLLGAVFGVFPQCGFSAAGSGLYAGRVITLGTLLSIYLSTSDEMLPIMISQGAPVGLMGRILLYKILIGFLAGFFVDLFAGRHRACEGRLDGRCGAAGDGHNESHIFGAALMRTLQVAFFIFLVTFCLNIVLNRIGEAALSDLFLSRSIVGEMIAGLIGMIPNCAASVTITQLYLEGVLNFGVMLSGLLTGSGIGLLVLYRVNRNWKENIAITGILYAFGTVCGVLVNAFGLG